MWDFCSPRAVSAGSPLYLVGERQTTWKLRYRPYRARFLFISPQSAEYYRLRYVLSRLEELLRAKASFSRNDFILRVFFLFSKPRKEQLIRELSNGIDSIIERYQTILCFFIFFLRLLPFPWEMFIGTGSEERLDVSFELYMIETNREFTATNGA